MAVRLVVTFHATPGKGAELTQAMKARCEISRQDAGCEQFEVFQSVFDPDKLVLLELWKDQAALDAHAKLQAQRPALPDGLRLGAGERISLARPQGSTGWASRRHSAIGSVIAQV
jgi:quinol monooxygenase YgiN